jgi:hypothetical protein
VRPGNPWDLKGCQQKQGESLRDYIWCFSQKCHELPKICDANIISVFWSGMNYWTLVHELGCVQPKTMKELLDIATRHNLGEEVVSAIFIRGSGKVALSDGRGVPPKTTDKGVKRGATSNKRGLKRRPQRVTDTTICDEGDNDKDVSDSDEELITAAKRNFKRRAR